jgi:ribonuclease HI
LVVFPDGRRQERARDLGHGTNNVGELTALRLALDIFDESDVAPEAHVALFTDSKYAIGVLMQGWKAKANRELILDLRDRFARRSGARLFWVPGHAGVAENERADVLASGAARGVEVG